MAELEALCCLNPMPLLAKHAPIGGSLAFICGLGTMRPPTALVGHCAVVLCGHSTYLLFQARSVKAGVPGRREAAGAGWNVARLVACMRRAPRADIY